MATPTYPLNRREFQRLILGLPFLGSSMAIAAGSPQRLKVAVAQMSSTDGDIDGNLIRATHLAELAHAKGAQLILFPEFMPTGYALNESLWSAAEPHRGKTARWLSKTSSRLRCCIGTCFLEAQGEDFFDTFLMTGPDGQELGRVRKETPASMEAPFVKGESGSRVIQASFGRIGVGICFESYLCSLERQLTSARPDIILLPHSFPGAAETGRLASPPGTHVAGWYARRFGVPVLMTNKVGAWSTTTPSGVTLAGRFPGASAIVDSNGNVLASMDDQAGVAVAEVSLDPTRKTDSESSCQGEYIADLAATFAAPSEDSATPPPAPAIPDYLTNPNRARAALAVSKADGGQ